MRFKYPYWILITYHPSGAIRHLPAWERKILGRQMPRQSREHIFYSEQEVSLAYCREKSSPDILDIEIYIVEYPNSPRRRLRCINGRWF